MTSVCICGSMVFIDDMEAIAQSLTRLGYAVTTPAREEANRRWDELAISEATVRKKGFIDNYLAHIRHSDVVLIANFAKYDIEGYVGPNTLLEAAFAYALGIPVVFLYDPMSQPCGLECISIAHGCLDGEAAQMSAAISFGSKSAISTR